MGEESLQLAEYASQLIDDTPQLIVYAWKLVVDAPQLIEDM